MLMRLSARFAELVIFVFFVFGIKPVFANDQEAKVFDLGRIIVTETRSPAGLDQTFENVTVVSEDELSRLPVRDLGEALNYVSGVYIEPRQGFGRAVSISLQGSDSRQVRVMIDGIPLNSQSSGQVNPAKFPMENISRIEIIKGACSSLWGSGLGGVINIITKDTGQTVIPKGSVTSSFAEFRTKKENFEISGKAGGLGYYAFAGYLESGGKGLSDDVLDKKSFTKLAYDLGGAGKLNALFGYTTADISSGEYPDGSWQSTPAWCHYSKIGWIKDYNDITLNVDLKHFRQRIVTRTYNSLAEQQPSSISRSKDVLYQLSPNLAARLNEKSRLVMGADFDWDKIKAENLTAAKELNLQSPYINYTLDLEPWNFNLGLRYDCNDEFGQDLSPAAGVIYHLDSASGTLIRAAVSRAFTAPPLKWKYFNETSAAWVSNPDIEAEHAHLYELGMETRLISKSGLKVSLYRSDISGAIATAVNENNKRYKKNFQKFRRQGVETEIKAELFPGLSVFAAAAVNDIEDRITKQTRQDAGSPRQSFDLGLEYKSKRGFNVYLNGYYDYWNKTYDMYLPEDRKFIFDLKLTRKIKNFTYFLNIYNLTNSKYWSDYYFPIPERYFEGGVTLTW